MKNFIKHIVCISILFICFTLNSNSELKIKHQFNRFNGTDFVNLKSNSSVVENDTVTSNKITKVWYTATELNIQVFQVFKQQEITITVYNMLGKEVLEVFRGTSSVNQEEVYSKTFNLPNGIYICVMQGKNFKSTEKFIISR